MKRLLVIAMVFVFAASAFAVNLELKGGAEMFGRMHSLSYDSGITGDEEFENSYSMMLGYYRLDGKMIIDESTIFNIRALLFDGWYGGDGNALADRGNINGIGAQDSKVFDRFWVDYKLTDNIALAAGRMPAAYNGGDFGLNWYVGAQGWNRDWAGGHDSVRIDYTLNDTATIFAAFDMLSQDFRSGTASMDADLFVLGAKIKPTSDISINPTLTYMHASNATAMKDVDEDGLPGNDNNDDANNGALDTTKEIDYDKPALGKAIGFHLNVEKMPATGIQVKGNFAMYKQLADNMTVFENSTGGYEKPMLFGASLEGTYVTDTLKAGAFFAYASSDEDAVASFAFGDDWNKTQIIDNGLHLTGGLGTTGMMQLGLYTEIELVEKLTLNIVGAYYMNAAGEIANSNGQTPARWGDLNGGTGVFDNGDYVNINGPAGTSKNINNNGGYLYKDATMYEFDLYATYQWTKATGFRLGAAYMGASDLWREGDSLSDLAVYGHISTWF
ncbi:MAG: hypothetical protein LBV04_08545 [Deferribacteraceae bacterium]|jgi:hypothetical protein|nr:hypothetical protein [Deferribacteraceae bacterium]